MSLVGNLYFNYVVLVSTTLGFYSTFFRVNNLVPNTMFILMLLQYATASRLLANLQHYWFDLDHDQLVLLKFIPTLTAISSGQGSNEDPALNQQTVLHALTLFCRCVKTSGGSSLYRNILDVVVDFIQQEPLFWHRHSSAWLSLFKPWVSSFCRIFSA